MSNMWNQNPSFRFVIDNFSEKEASIASHVFVAGGCEWYLSVRPNGDNDHLSLYLFVANRKSLRTGWKRSARYYFRVLNESNKELFRSSIFGSECFCAESPGWGTSKTLPLSNFHEKEFLENDKLIIEVYIKDVEAFGDINGFQVFAAHVASVKKIITEHVVKTEYKNTLSNACSKLSELAEVGVKLEWLKSKFDEVSFKRKNADGAGDESLVQLLEERIKNLELIESDSKKDSLKSNLDERMKNLEVMVSDFKKDCFKSNLEERIKNLEVMVSDSKKDCLESNLDERMKNLELMVSDSKKDCLTSSLEVRIDHLEVTVSVLEKECLKSKLEVFSQKKKSHAAEIRFQKLEERLKNLEVMELGLKLDSLRSKLEEVSLEKKKSHDRAQILEGRVKNIELMETASKLDGLKLKLEEIDLGAKKAYDADKYRVQELEERVKELEVMKVGFKLDCLNTKIDESLVQQLEERVDLEVMKAGFKCLNTKVEKVSLESKESDDARFQQLEERFNNIDLMVSSLGVELDKKKNKSCEDGFLLID